MISFVKTFRAASAVAAFAFAVSAVPASALPITYIFNGTLDDNSAATGAIALNVYGYNVVPTAITTTDGIFTGYAYVVGTDPSNINNPLDTILDLSRSTPNFYQGFLHLVFDHSLVDGTVDTLIASESFECDTYDDGFGNCSGGQGHIRYFTEGSVSPAPEPATLALFGAGLAGFAARRRKRA